METALDCVIGELKGRLLFVWVGSQIRAYAINLLCIKIAFGYRFGRTEESVSISYVSVAPVPENYNSSCSLLSNIRAHFLGPR